MNRRPDAHQPQVGAMLVLAHVSSMQTRRLGSIRAWYFFHLTRRRATSGRSCSLGSRLFFEAQAFAANEVPQRSEAHQNLAFGKLSLQAPQGDMRLGCKACEDEIAMTGQQYRAMPANLSRRRAARFAHPLRPLHHARRADSVSLGN